MEHFLKNPTTQFYIKELSRMLEISPRSALEAMKMFGSENILIKEEIGLAHLYRLNNELPLVKSLKRMHILFLLHENEFVEKAVTIDENMISLVLYGSYSSGDYDERSDLDLIMITQKDKSEFDGLATDMEESLSVPVSIEVFTLANWKRLAKRGDAFHSDVVREHVLLFGSEID
ncbi:MAG: nucleotidyltransferase domain-containing protein [Thermoplasmata archaeon]|nr:nucleotidyltransferase domain-containing protein [Thermoplasmata archaeon]